MSKEDNAFQICVQAGVISQCPKCAHIDSVDLDNSEAAYAVATNLQKAGDPLAEPFGDRPQLMGYIDRTLKKAEDDVGGCTCNPKFNDLARSGP